MSEPEPKPVASKAVDILESRGAVQLPTNASRNRLIERYAPHACSPTPNTACADVRCSGEHAFYDDKHPGSPGRQGLGYEHIRCRRALRQLSSLFSRLCRVS